MVDNKAFKNNIISFAIVFIVMFSLVIFSSCSNNNDFIGKFKRQDLNTSKYKLSVEINDDGTARYYRDATVYAYNWRLEDNGNILKLDYADNNKNIDLYDKGTLTAYFTDSSHQQLLIDGPGLNWAIDVYDRVQ